MTTKDQILNVVIAFYNEKVLEILGEETYLLNYEMEPISYHFAKQGEMIKYN